MTQSKDPNPVRESVKQHLEWWEKSGIDYLPKSNVILSPSTGRSFPFDFAQGQDDTRGDNRSPSMALEDLRKNEIGECTRCPLHKGRTHLVFGVGNPEAQLMFVGEGPGADEDAQGEPFVGRAGQLLTKMIGAMGFARCDVYIANIVKCLRYNAMVQLGDGSWERIGRLVRQRYSGTVMSVDTAGRLVPRKVIGWHTSPLADRPVFRLSFRSARKNGSYKAGIYLTGDHPVLTERGYLPVQELGQSDRIAIGQGLSSTVKNLILGSLLGDGHLNAKEAHFSFSHSLKQEIYAQFKADLLQEELGCTIEKLAVAAGGDQKYPIIKCYTRAHRSLWPVRDDFYGSQKRVPDYLEITLNPMMLAFWFMDDGYLRLRPPRQPSAEIATVAFNQHDREVLIRALKHLGLEAYERAGRLHFNVHETKKLSQIIAPYIPPSMRYKLIPEIRLRIPFNPDLFLKSYRETMYDLVEIEKIRFNGTDKTFYCIDVEETGNFVTVGGVVHNCRPPGNRNPEPVEIATCLPFLKKQIDIIHPKVIVCLGKIASQVLLQTEIPITKLRGEFRDYGDIKIMPTYHPAFLLRNPAMKKPVWEDLKKVMAYLTSTVSLGPMAT